ncbi:transglycosylase SLT domain-containing protein [Duffyella gerundensis]|uniref:transglycosylase SLT domain-containing protein n=1 Tax=Duffyella gerundensis TaxID=1619313 RepID=UPI0021F6C287|nr:transglycosylase SLT domain-containing protein [Duffyella gerundensis]
MAYRSVLTAALLLSAVNSMASTNMQSVPSGYQKVALQHGVPAESLYSLALAESSRQLPHGTRPWPWTINVAGKGYRYESRQAAWQALQQFMKNHPLKRIDVGIAQVNLGWNGHRFSSTWDAFDPYINLNAAARILRECWERSPGSWLKAAGCYHHPAGGKPAARYRQIVSEKLALLSPAQPRPITTQAPANLASNQTPSTEIIWTEPRRQQ